MPVTDRDYGYSSLLVRVKDATPTVIKVGVPDTAREDGKLNDEIGMVHEFGLGHVPQRSFIRAWVDQNYGAIEEELTSAATTSVKGGKSWNAAMRDFATYCVRGIRAHIRTNIPPPLQAKTVARKGSSVALIETQQLINSVTSEIDMHGDQPVQEATAFETSDTVLGADPLAKTEIAPVDAYADTELPGAAGDA